MDQVAVAIDVIGKVQGVFFRESTRKMAEELGLKGTVRNLPDGSVHIEAQGPANAIDRLIEWCHHGPPRARVDQVQHEKIHLFEMKEFNVVR